ncbi:MAG: hypothetical protein Q8L98_04585 [Chlamydiales bacterium]|nr:hypothetical protein [Chlamydiales bacterium]
MASTAIRLDVETSVELLEVQDAAVQVTEAQATAQESSSSNPKHLGRVNFNGSRSESEKTSAPAADTAAASSDQQTVQMSSMEEIMKLLKLVTDYLSAAQIDQATILNMVSEQGNASITAANASQADLNAQLAQQAKRQKHMKMLGWAMKALAITIVVVSIATGQPELAPLSTLLMTSLTALMIAKPELITNGLISPLSKGLEGLGVPEKYATLLATVIVTAVLVIGTAGVGAAADSSLIGSQAAQAGAKAGASAATDAARVGTQGVDYLKLGLGNAGIATSGIVGVTQPFTKLLTEMFPNHPMAAALVGTILTLTICLGAGMGGASSVSSSGYFNNLSSEGIQRAARLITQALRGVEALGMGGSAWMLFEQGQTTLALAEAQADLTITKNTSEVAANLSVNAQNMMKTITNTMEEVNAAIQSLTAPSSAYLRYAR